MEDKPIVVTYYFVEISERTIYGHSYPKSELFVPSEQAGRATMKFARQRLADNTMTMKLYRVDYSPTKNKIVGWEDIT